MTRLFAIIYTHLCLIFAVGCTESHEIKAEATKLTDNLTKIENENREMNAVYLKEKAITNDFMEILKSSLANNGQANTPQSLNAIQAELEFQIRRLEKEKVKLEKEVKLQRNDLESYRATYIIQKSN
jgi:hypothetical protein